MNSMNYMNTCCIAMNPRGYTDAISWGDSVDLPLAEP